MSTKLYLRTLIAVFLTSFCSFASGQTIKAGVMVIGGSPAGIAAAIQSAHSGVKTVLIENTGLESLSLAREEEDMGSGIYRDFIKRVESAQKYPVTPNQVFSPSFTAVIVNAWADTVKNLTILKKVSVSSFSGSGKGWEAVLSDRREVKADVVVDCSPSLYVASMASVKPAAQSDSVSYSSKLYRTGVAVTRSDVYPATLPLKWLIGSEDNFLIPPVSRGTALNSGQAAGALAAYRAFFKTTTEKINVRMIQGELVSYGARLVKFDDIAYKDSNAVAVQYITLTGILKGKASGGKFLFLPDSTVSSEEIKLPVKEYYSRSQIWFLDNKAEKLTLKQLLSLIKYTAARGDELNREVEKGWSISLKLPGKYDLSKFVTRREVAVLFTAYLRPFTVNVDINGKLKQ